MGGNKPDPESYPVAADYLPADTPAAPALRTRCVRDITPTPGRWIWPGRLPLGRHSLLIGAPGEGKSFLTPDLAARVSTGDPWPDGANCQRGSVLQACAVDDPADTIAPRLRACGAVKSRIHVVDGIATDDPKHDRPWWLDQTRELLATLDQLPDRKLLIIDPIESYLDDRVASTTVAHRVFVAGSDTVERWPDASVAVSTTAWFVLR